MRGNVSLSRPRGRTADDITEWLVRADPSKSACLPLAKIVLNTALAGFSEEPPWLPARSRHDCYLVKFDVSILGPISTPKSLNQTCLDGVRSLDLAFLQDFVVGDAA
jgi:hypothetical protein